MAQSDIRSSDTIDSVSYDRSRYIIISFIAISLTNVTKKLMTDYLQILKNF